VRAVQTRPLHYRSHDVSAVRTSLHWLAYQVKVTKLSFDILTTGHLVYLSELIQKRVPVRSLRSSSDQNVLVVPRVRTKHGARAFGFAAPSAWNIFPRNVRDTKTVQESTEDVLVWSLG